jgi:hypothetical protein
MLRFPSEKAAARKIPTVVFRSFPTYIFEMSILFVNIFGNGVGRTTSGGRAKTLSMRVGEIQAWGHRILCPSSFSHSLSSHIISAVSHVLSLSCPIYLIVKASRLMAVGLGVMGSADLCPRRSDLRRGHRGGQG